MKVAAVMSRPVITVFADEPIKDAARMLVRHGISALPVIDVKGSLIGIVSEADLLPIETRPDPRSQATPIAPTAGVVPRTVADVMTRKVETVAADVEVSQAARLMIEADVKRLPVMNGGQLVGIVSRGDLMRVIARRDRDLQRELDRRIRDLGVGIPPDSIKVEDGVVFVQGRLGSKDQRLVESVALTVPGVLEVRFATPTT